MHEPTEATVDVSTNHDARSDSFDGIEQLTGPHMVDAT